MYQLNKERIGLTIKEMNKKLANKEQENKALEKELENKKRGKLIRWHYSLK